MFTVMEQSFGRDKIFTDYVFVKDIVLASRETKLHSVNSIRQSFVRFINQTKCVVRIYWLDYEGKKRLYNNLKPTEFLDVNTFATHLWVFENSQTGDRLLGGGKYVFQAEPWFENYGSRGIIELRKAIPITYPVYSLKSRALQVVRDRLSSVHQIEELELPKCIMSDLKYLVQKQQCFLKHKENCKCSW